MPNRNIKFIVVANGSKALIYKSLGNIHHIELLEKFTSDLSHIKSHDLARDRAGQGKEGADETVKGGLGATGDLHKKEKHNFLHHVSDYINSEANNGAFAHLIIAASPEALGEIRNLLGKKAKELLLHEINKDLTHVVAQDIPDFIEKYIEA